MARIYSGRLGVAQPVELPRGICGRGVGVRKQLLRLFVKFVPFELLDFVGFWVLKNVLSAQTDLLGNRRLLELVSNPLLRMFKNF